MVGFVEKPEQPRGLLSRPGFALASMGIYVFDTQVLIDVLKADARCRDSAHDFGRDIIPRMVASERPVCAYNVQEEVSRDFYWRDIGTIDAYWEASMELLSATPLFDLCDPVWPVHTCDPGLPAAQILLENGFNSQVADVRLCSGVQIVDAQVNHSILGPGVTVDPQAEVCESVLLEGAHVGAGARVHRAIVGPGVRIPAGSCIEGTALGRERDFHVSPGGIAVVSESAALATQGEPRAANNYFG